MEYAHACITYNSLFDATCHERRVSLSVICRPISVWVMGGGERRMESGEGVHYVLPDNTSKRTIVPRQPHARPLSICRDPLRASPHLSLSPSSSSRPSTHPYPIAHTPSHHLPSSPHDHSFPSRPIHSRFTHFSPLPPLLTRSQSRHPQQADPTPSEPDPSARRTYPSASTASPPRHNPRQ